MSTNCAWLELQARRPPARSTRSAATVTSATVAPIA